MPFTEEQLDAQLSLVPDTPTIRDIRDAVVTYVQGEVTNVLQLVQGNINGAVDARITTVVQSPAFRDAVAQIVADILAENG